MVEETTPITGGCMCGAVQLLGMSLAELNLRII